MTQDSGKFERKAIPYHHVALGVRLAIQREIVDFFCVFSSSDAIHGAPCHSCLFGSCDVMSCEVTRLLKLCDDGIQPVSVVIPRRDKMRFHEELFPPAPGEGYSYSSTFRKPPFLSPLYTCVGCENRIIIDNLCSPPCSSPTLCARYIVPL